MNRESGGILNEICIAAFFPLRIFICEKSKLENIRTISRSQTPYNAGFLPIPKGPPQKIANFKNALKII